MAENTATFGIVIDSSRAKKGAKEVNASLRSMGKTAGKQQKNMSSGFDRMRRTMMRAFAVVGFAVLTKQAMEMADTFTNVQNRLKLVTNGTEELASVTNELFLISNRTRSSFVSTAEVYARTSLAVKEMGRSQAEVLQFTESLNQAVILSGANAAESSAGMIQLAQGMASGALRGDELRSVMEQLPAVADVIAKGLGITRGELRKLGEQGKITTDIILDSFRKSSAELNEMFAKTVPTMGQSFQVMRNMIIRFIGEFDRVSEVSRTVSRLIFLTATSIDSLRMSMTDSDSAMSGFLSKIRSMVDVTNDVISFVELGEFVKALKLIGLHILKATINWTSTIVDWTTNLGILVAAAVGGAVVAGITNGLQTALDHMRTKSTWIAEQLADLFPEDVSMGFMDSFIDIAAQLRGTKNVISDFIGPIKDEGVKSISKAINDLSWELYFLQKQRALKDLNEDIVQLEKFEVKTKVGFFERLRMDYEKFEQSFGNGFAEAVAEMDTQLDKAAELGSSTADILTDSFQDFFEGFGHSINDVSSLMEGLQSLASSVADAVIKELIRIYIVEQLVGMIGGFMGGLGKSAGGAAGAGGGFKPVEGFDLNQSIVHTGGVIGSDTLKTRSINPMAFAGAQMYHGGGVAGLKSNEVPAILEKGEGVFTKGQMQALGAGAATPEVIVNVYNIVEPVDVPAQLRGRQGQKEILNVISQNPDTINAVQ